MAQTRKDEAQVEIKCSADKFFDVWALNTPQLSNTCSSIPNIELVQGENCHTIGSILSWNYASPLDGKHECLKTVLEDIDEKNKTFSNKVIEGEMMDKYYKTWRQKIEFIQKSEDCTIIKWSMIEYEKKSEDAPDPIIYGDFFFDCIKQIDRHLYSA